MISTGRWRVSVSFAPLRTSNSAPSTSIFSTSTREIRNWLRMLSSGYALMWSLLGDPSATDALAREIEFFALFVPDDMKKSTNFSDDEQTADCTLTRAPLAQTLSRSWFTVLGLPSIAITRPFGPTTLAAMSEQCPI